MSVLITKEEALKKVEEMVKGPIRKIEFIKETEEYYIFAQVIGGRIIPDGTIYFNKVNGSIKRKISPS